MKNIFIDLLAFGAIFSSVLVITSKNPVIAVIFLISVFVNAAGYLILTGVGFIGITYIILYVGAITVLFLFVIMMLNIKLVDILESRSQYLKNLPLGLAVGLLFIYEMFNIIPFSFNNVSIVSYLINLLNSLNGLLLFEGAAPLRAAATEGLRQSINNSVYTSFNPVIADTAFTNFLQIQAIGQGLYTYGAIWLILCSVILLLAMVAPIFISRITRSEGTKSPATPAAQAPQV